MSTGRYRRIFESFCGLLLLGSVVVALLEIIGRVLWGLSFDFFVDLSVWLTTWATLLLAGPVLLEGGHVSIDLLRTRLKGSRRFALEFLNATVVLAYGLLITVGGLLLVTRLYASGTVFPRYFLYVVKGFGTRFPIF